MDDRRNKADAVYAQLRREIESGELPPGSSLSEHTLVARLGASRTPVRDALRRLLDDDLAVRDGSRGSLRVSQISAAGVRDLFGYRQVLEGAAMRQLAQAIADGRVDPAPIAQLEDELRGLRARQPSASRTVAFYELAERFDALVRDLTPNPLLGKAIRDLRPHTTRLRSIAHHRPARDEVSMAEHTQMMTALLGGKPKAAERACAEHLQHTVEAIFAGIADAAPSTVAL
ncbi:GntR family transcriptional regulator [Arsenicicoccus piscis]|uniref:GntR family transcriptional regulator n=1 Tax=Arsenicicoccus piscis TaxID=673954 RepID=UPI001F4C6FA9|nr:GntR family transcriptional regulator [Arsenicicoccus piscis]MCH8628348.1 GntR family transcriptional regulator [Arsenicicoccus piscis]